MSVLVVSLLIASAIVHAGWNALLKLSDDRLWSISIITLTGACAAVPFALVLTPPSLQSWPYIFLSSVLQVAYCLFLIRAYRHGDLANVYPIARGSAPLMVTLGAALFAREVPGVETLIGILLISLGILILTSGAQRADAKTSLAALTAGGFIASYMVVDGIGVRVGTNALGYAAWQAVIAGILIPLAYIIIRRKPLPMPRGRDGLTVLIAGILSTLGYCIAVWAMSLTTMGGVSALRETSILFAALIGVTFLKEKVSVQKILCAVAVTAGVVIISLG
ncbi:MAG: EamA family transporter [Pseudomonadota bacterium]